ncbi:MAG: isochorismate synthase [Paludibacter sp.]|nr:isochorismate synthase [Paludibacter sp.]
MQNPSIFHAKLAALQTCCLNSSSSFVSFKLPLENNINTYVQFNSSPRSIDSVGSIDSVEGFVFSPFLLDEKNKAYVVEPDYKFVNNNLPDDIFEIISSKSIKSKIATTIRDNACATTSKEEFEASVAKALEAIHRGDFQKVVLSKIQHVDKPDGFSEAAFFQSLCEQYPYAFVYFISIGANCCWMGATPEPLLVSANNCMQTVSLAGTQQADDKSIGEYVWSVKELEEQEIVTQFIEETLLEKGICDYRKSKTQNYKAANLIHLKSSFEFPIDVHKNALSSLISALHPTPSIGGLPRAEAVEFITQTEKHDRGFYTGFLGALQPNSDVQLFVNLRCMQLFPSSILLYSGAGITSSSRPDKEWIETENKLQTLKQVIFSPKY